MDQQKLVDAQFGVAAMDYLQSPTHAQGADLERLRALADGQRDWRVLDLGCGAGHASFALAGEVMEVMAYDLSTEMLVVVAAEAQRRKLANVQTQQGVAETLPFADARFDLVVTRFSAHHWADVPRALREVRRVLQPEGRLVVIDVVAPETPLLDTLLQSIEVLRDASHVRNYRCSEWEVMLVRAGFVVSDREGWKLPLCFESWIARMRTPALRVAAIRSLCADAATEVRDYFAIQPNNDCAIDAAWIEAVPPPA
ncbi:class I SAM-dependent methyltransferase [Acidithiobacillus sp.]|jgi:ubiquinone/menaquinone biosynthesis C-methylase UbiE|uniref:class I SAM-dependent methyltransferase n=1 Tax=Acidithiobacillus sp. TaxID=1872118 RepID=UPI0025C62E36|nr:class I SAM-dependent methyltransferase [Acidithiobacillus sp.]MCK9188669.1 class I SAM-dependent methyltransferase [Acidithiobacillus sp.]MCK9360585.1 class I SAM-dependent methyltransferase [Acidithiobacillus sp.]